MPPHGFDPDPAATSSGRDGRPPLDAVLARIASHFCHLDALSDADQAALLALGYIPVATLAWPGSLHAMTLFPLPERQDVPPVLAFRGGDDLDAPAVGGMYAFSRNEAAIAAELRALGGGVIVTGHGVGGAVAQIAAALHPGLIARAVAFQSPRVGADLIARVRAGTAAPGTLAAEPAHDDYVRLWFQIRADAESGAVLYADLVDEIETHALMATASRSHTTDAGGLRGNLDRLFPELRAASHLEEHVLDGRITNADRLVYTVAAGGVGITEERRDRLHVYYGAVLADRDLLGAWQDDVGGIGGPG